MEGRIHLIQEWKLHKKCYFYSTIHMEPNKLIRVYMSVPYNTLECLYPNSNKIEHLINLLFVVDHLIFSFVKDYRSDTI